MLRSQIFKLAYKMYETQGALDIKDPLMDYVVDIHDLGVVITHSISRLSKDS